jgi:prophage antirepressor-like protein
MTAVTPFDFEGRAVRVVEDAAGMPWFVALDVCECLGIRNSRDAVARLDEDERSDVGITDTRSKGDGTQARSMLAVNEPGLYSLTLTSRKPEAKRFKRWITHEVLPSLRRTGTYSLPSAPPPPVLAAQPQHRADQLVSAGRIFSAALRTARQLRMPPAQAMQAAFACAHRHTGIDWADELDAALPEPVLPAADPLQDAITEYLAGVDSFEMAHLIEALHLGDPRDSGLMKRIGAIARRHGWAPRRHVRPGGAFYTVWRPLTGGLGGQHKC